MLMNIDIRRILTLYVSITILIVISILIYFYKTQIIILLGGIHGLLGFFLLSFISCLSILPIPYITIVFRVARFFDPLSISIVVGIGSALGEAIAWSIGRATAHVLNDTVYIKRINVLLRYAKERGSWIVPLLAFIFSLTFLPDKLLYLPLGIMGYSIRRLLPFTILGKITMVYLVMVFGRLWSIHVEGSNSNGISFIITTVLLIIATIAMVYMDWERILYKR